MMTNELHSRVSVHWCFPEGGDSILSAFSTEPLPAKLQDNQRVSLARQLIRSHDQPGCTRAPKSTELRYAPQRGLS